MIAAATVAAQQAAWRDAGVASFDETWQTIADTFYEPGFGGIDWTAARAELRPRAEAAGSPDEIRKVIVELLARLKRSHFILLSSSSTDVENGPVGRASVAIDFRLTKEGVVITRVD